MKLSNKQFFVITILLHIFFIANAVFSIRNYQDFFLVSSLVLMIIYMVAVTLIFRRRCVPNKIVESYCFMIIVQILLFACSNATGIGPFTVLDLKILSLGSSLALIFYGVALIISCVTLLVISSIKYLLNK